MNIGKRDIGLFFSAGLPCLTVVPDRRISGRLMRDGKGFDRTAPYPYHTKNFTGLTSFIEVTTERYNKHTLGTVY